MTERRVRAVLAVVLAGLVVAGTGCSNGQGSAPQRTSAPAPSDYDRPAMRFGERVVSVEIADDAFERRRGLMHRTRLGANDGMLFVFEQRTDHGFWMKNTLIPLSIAFLRHLGEARFEVIRTLDMEPCELADTSKCPRYRAGQPYDVALEVNEGWFEEADVRAGDEAIYEPAP